MCPLPEAGLLAGNCSKSITMCLTIGYTPKAAILTVRKSPWSPVMAGFAGSIPWRRPIGG